MADDFILEDDGCDNCCAAPPPPPADACQCPCTAGADEACLILTGFKGPYPDTSYPATFCGSLYYPMVCAHQPNPTLPGEAVADFPNTAYVATGPPVWKDPFPGLPLQSPPFCEDWTRGNPGCYAGQVPSPVMFGTNAFAYYLGALCTWAFQISKSGCIDCSSSRKCILGAYSIAVPCGTNAGDTIVDFGPVGYVDPVCNYPCDTSFASVKLVKGKCPGFHGLDGDGVGGGLFAESFTDGDGRFLDNLVGDGTGNPTRGNVPPDWTESITYADALDSGGSGDGPSSDLYTGSDVLAGDGAGDWTVAEGFGDALIGNGTGDWTVSESYTPGSGGGGPPPCWDPNAQAARVIVSGTNFGPGDPCQSLPVQGPHDLYWNRFNGYFSGGNANGILFCDGTTGIVRYVVSQSAGPSAEYRIPAASWNPASDNIMTLFSVSGSPACGWPASVDAIPG